MSDGIEEVGQDVLSTINRHAGLGMALGIAIAIAGVLGLLSLATGDYLVSRPGIDRELGLVAL